MANIAFALALVALILSVALLLAVAQLSRTVGELRQAIVAGLGGSVSVQATQTQVDALANVDGRSTAVLVVVPRCPSCAQRMGEFTSLPHDPRVRRIVLSSDAVDVPESAEVEVVRDAALVGQLQVQATPVMIHLDASGTEQGRAVVGSERSMRRVLANISGMYAT